MKEEELACVEQMVAHFLKKEPGGPYWHILDVLCKEVRELQKNLKNCHKRLGIYARRIDRLKINKKRA